MKKIATVCLILLTSSLSIATAKQEARDRNNENFGVGELRESLKIRADVFLLDASGKRVLSPAGESRIWEPNTKEGKIVSNWSSGSKLYKKLHFNHQWKVSDIGEIHGVIRQYESIVEREQPGKDIKWGKLLKEERVVVKEMQPVVWRSVREKEKNVVVRFTPSISIVPSPKDVNYLEVSGTSVVIHDNRGYTWTNRVNFVGKYVVLITHKGTIALSYYPFEGSTEMGVAEGSRIDLKIDQRLRLNLVSTTPFIPVGSRFKVYGRFESKLRTTRFGSTRIRSTSKEDHMLEEFQD